MTNKITPEDWVTLWQSEMAGLAVDREWLEGLHFAAEQWNAVLAAAAAGRTGPDAAAGSAALGAAPGAGVDREPSGRDDGDPGKP